MKRLLARERTVGVEVSRTGSRRQNNDRVRLSVQFVMFARRDSAIARMQRQIEDDQCEKKKQTEKCGQALRIAARITLNCTNDQEI